MRAVFLSNSTVPPPPHECTVGFQLAAHLNLRASSGSSSSTCATTCTTRGSIGRFVAISVIGSQVATLGLLALNGLEQALEVASTKALLKPNQTTCEGAWQRKKKKKKPACVPMCTELPAR